MALVSSGSWMVTMHSLVSSDMKGAAHRGLREFEATALDLVIKTRGIEHGAYLE